MITIEGITVYFDVDETLTMFHGYETNDFAVSINHRHVRAIKEHAHRGHKIVVWSAGGAKWAEQVVKELELEKYVDVCMAKPSWFYDDKRAEEFMPEINRVYLKG